ncbi:MAG: glycosyltransferase family 39 protein, partial [Chloroflexota bacterium]|nr:glycosyltransferase family 39 protein [Chloroflexota bacterium]
MEAPPSPAASTSAPRRIEGPLGAVPLDLWAALFVLALALVMRLAFSFRAPPFVTNDSLSYLLPGFDLAHGLGFAPILKRPPLYPAFVGGVIALFGEELRVLVLVQHLIGVLVALATFALGRLAFGTAVGLLAGSLTALSGPLLIMEHYLMSETLFAALQVGALLAYLLGARSGRLRLFVAAGLLLGLAALTRPIAQLTLVVMLAGLPMLAPSWRPALRAAAVMLAVFAVTVVPWMVRNNLVQGTFAVAGGSGEGLAVRTIRYDQQFDFREPPGGDPDRQMARARRIYREEAQEGSAFELAGRIRDELRVSEIQAERLMRDIALDAILGQPIYYLQGTTDMFVATFA